MNKNILSKFTALLMLTTSVVMGGILPDPTSDAQLELLVKVKYDKNKVEVYSVSTRGCDRDETLLQALQKKIIEPGFGLPRELTIILLGVKVKDRFTNVTVEELAASWAKIRAQDPSYTGSEDFSKLPLRLVRLLGYNF